MKIKTSVSLSADVLAAIDDLAGRGGSRSAVIERVVRQHLARRARAHSRTRELDTLNRRADGLNTEAADVLDYQSVWPSE